MYTKSAFAGAALAAAVLTAGPASAAPLDIVGATVGCAYDAAATSGLVCSDGTFEVTEAGGTPDLTLQDSGPTDVIDIVFMGGWIGIDSVVPALDLTAGTNEILTFTGLVSQFVASAPLELRGISISGIDNLEESDFVLNGSTLTIDFSGTNWADGASVGFDVAVPLPASVFLLMGGLAGLGLVARRKSAAA